MSAIQFNSIKNKSIEIPSYMPPLIITVVAIAAIASLTVGLLAHFQILQGLNAMIQWTMVGSGAFALVATAAIATIYFHGKKHTIPLESDAYQRVKQLFQEKEYASVDTEQLAVDISALSHLQLQKILEEFFEGLAARGEDPLTEITAVAKCLPTHALQNMIKTLYPSSRQALKTAKKMVGEARYYLEARKLAQPTLHARALTVLDTFISIVDSVLAAFGVADFFKPADGSSFQAEFKFQKIMMLIAFFTLLTSTLLPLLGVTTGASIVGGALLLVAVLSVLWPHIRPLVTHLPHAENWTRQVQMKQLWTSGGRKIAVREIAEALMERRHPLVIGPSGIGKTQTIIAFVEAIERGDFPELKGKRVFYFNTADFVGNHDLFSGRNDILKKINEIIGRHREDVILVFDEIHLAYQSNDKSAIGEQLKTFLDEKPENSFPYVIGLTTIEEYYRDIYKDNSAADRRFVKVEISNTDFLDTQAILNKYMLQKAPEIIVDPAALSYLINQTQNMPQPLTAKRILEQCVTRAKIVQSKKSTKLEGLKTQLEAEYARGAVLGHALLAEENAHLQLVDQLEKQLKQLQREIEQEKQHVEQLNRTKEHLVHAKEQKYETALQVAARKVEKTNQFLLLKYFVERALEKEVRKKSAALGAKCVIDKEMIDAVLQEEYQNKKKRDEALERGKTQLKSRST